MAKYVNEANLQRFWDNIQDQIGSASQEQVDAWLDEHPEATTTVQDGAITTDKLADGAVTDIKVADGGIKGIAKMVSESSDVIVTCDYKVNIIKADAARFGLYLTKPLLRLRWKPYFTDGQTLATEGTFTWYRYESTTELADNAPLIEVDSGVTNVGEFIDLYGVTERTVVAIELTGLESQYRLAYSGKLYYGVGLALIRFNPLRATNITSLSANSHPYGDFEMIPLDALGTSRLSETIVKLMDEGIAKKTVVDVPWYADSSLEWCFYFDNNRDNIRITPEFEDMEASGEYEWELYKTEAQTIEDSTRCYLYASGSESIGSGVYFDRLEKNEIFAVKPVSGNRLKYHNQSQIEDMHLAYIRLSGTGGNADFRVKFPTVGQTPHNDFAFGCTIETFDVPDRYAGKRWLAMGDSLTEENFRCAHNYHYYVAQHLGLTVLNHGLSGSGYKRSENNSGAFYQRVSDIDPDDFDFITIFGSGNDHWYSENMGTVTDTTSDTLFGCVNLTLENYYEAAPFKPIGIVTPCAWADYPPNVPDNWMEEYSDGLIEIARRWGIPVLDLYHSSGLRPWDANFRLEYYKSDVNGTQDEGVHPNSEGHRVFLAPKFEEFIKTLIG